MPPWMWRACPWMWRGVVTCSAELDGRAEEEQLHQQVIRAVAKDAEGRERGEERQRQRRPPLKVWQYKEEGRARRECDPAPVCCGLVPSRSVERMDHSLHCHQQRRPGAEALMHQVLTRSAARRLDDRADETETSERDPEQ